MNGVRVCVCVFVCVCVCVCVFDISSRESVGKQTSILYGAPTAAHAVFCIFLFFNMAGTRQEGGGRHNLRGKKKNEMHYFSSMRCITSAHSSGALAE
jgi:hypothetical protein